MLLSAFVTLYKGYLGVRPTEGLWARIFHFKSQMVASGVMLPNPKGPHLSDVAERVMVECDAATIYTNSKTTNPNPKPLQSVKKFQKTFFYARTPENKADCHNLPEFVLAPSTTKHSWG